MQKTYPQPAENQPITKSYKKRCLIGLQKGVSNTPKGHLFQAN
ncbi:hypothetical protein HMPREF9148_02049 [Prevotella sp. F0091]|nr:hypothetical protein HMPREF9148_02049 [Prevotella sp. F0091]